MRGDGSQSDASLCKNCGKCAGACPQGIAIPAELKKVSGHLGGLPTKVLLCGVEVLLRVRKFTNTRGMRKEHG